MLHGCGNSECKQMLCENGRHNAVGGPTRRYTPRSARTIALTLASGPRPRSRLCPRQDDKGTYTRSRTDEGPRDPSSLVQLLADTSVCKRLCVPEEAPVLGGDLTKTPNTISTFGERTKALRTGHAILDVVDAFLDSIETAENKENHKQSIASKLFDALEVLLETLPPAQYDLAHDLDQLRVVDTVVQNGLTAPLRIMKDVKASDARMWIEYLDIMEDSRALRLLERWVSLMGHIAEIENFTPATFTGRFPQQPEDPIFGKVVHCMVTHSTLREVYSLVIWLKKIFLIHWDGAPLLRSATVPLASLLLIEAIRVQDQKRFDESPMTAAEHYCFGMRIAIARLDPLEIAQAWFDVSESRADGATNLIDFHFLFSTSQRAIYFRAINHLRMQLAHADADKASTLRSRTVRSSYNVDSDAQLSCLEDHYLLLHIGRSTIIRDSLNQLWQRRSGELLRPLRVRLGEMDNFEVGHDLGGVQIELFNLLCKEMFGEELGMFTTNPSNGFSYFRPGCLQPLYMFEMFGLLFALAIFNGITLPVSFPLVFYMKLLDQQPYDVGILWKSWPAIYKSLKDILEQDIPGLESVFPMEANGLRLSISGFLDQTYDKEAGLSRMTSQAVVADVTPIVHHSEAPNRMTTESSQPRSPSSSEKSVDLQSINWPGWIFRPESSDGYQSETPDGWLHSPAGSLDVTSDNKQKYVQDYVLWLTYGSVAPQWNRFMVGFRRIFSLESLSILSPQQLRSIVEGTDEISIPELRAATSYDGYNPNSTYIKTFWSIVEAWPPAKQIQLFKFVTAAERVPIGGAGAVAFKISRISIPGAEELLPTSSTCFGNMMLPRYQNGAVLEEKLTVALEMGGEGFGTG